MTSSEGTKGAEAGQARFLATTRGEATDEEFARWLLADMLAAAHDAAGLIRERGREASSLVWQAKSPTDFVSEVDTGAEAIVRSHLDRQRVGPLDVTCRVVGEELSPEAAVGGEGVVFVVDPLDGTTNFLHGYPWYAVSIGALVDGTLAAGVVLNVATGELFTATRGGGARRNGTPIAVSANADPQRALVGTGFPFKHLDRLEQYQRQFAAIAGRTAGMRRAGAAALDLCDVACGRFDGFWELSLMPWDVAAGLLIIREAGGVVTDLEGTDCDVRTGPVVAGSAALHPWLLATLQGA